MYFVNNCKGNLYKLCVYHIIKLIFTKFLYRHTKQKKLSTFFGVKQVSWKLTHIIGPFWLSNLTTTGLVFFLIDWLQQILVQSDFMNINPVVTRLLIQITRNKNICSASSYNELWIGFCMWYKYTQYISICYYQFQWKLILSISIFKLMRLNMRITNIVFV